MSGHMPVGNAHKRKNCAQLANPPPVASSLSYSKANDYPNRTMTMHDFSRQGEFTIPAFQRAAFSLSGQCSMCSIL